MRNMNHGFRKLHPSYTVTLLFDRDKSVISRHLRNVFKEKELDWGSTVAFFATVQNEGDLEIGDSR